MTSDWMEEVIFGKRASDQKVSVLPGVNYATHLKWKDGKPVIVGVPIVEGAVAPRMKELLIEAMNLPYDGPDQRYAGLSKGEAMIIELVDQASLGCSTARKEVLDRALGKPVQNIRSVSLRGTIEDFLDELPTPAQDESEEGVDPVEEADIIEETVSEAEDI